MEGKGQRNSDVSGCSSGNLSDSEKRKAGKEGRSFDKKGFSGSDLREDNLDALLFTLHFQNVKYSDNDSKSSATSCKNEIDAGPATDSGTQSPLLAGGRKGKEIARGIASKGTPRSKEENRELSRESDELLPGESVPDQNELLLLKKTDKMTNFKISGYNVEEDNVTLSGFSFGENSANSNESNGKKINVSDSSVRSSRSPENKKVKLRIVNEKNGMNQFEEEDSMISIDQIDGNQSPRGKHEKELKTNSSNNNKMGDNLLSKKFFVRNADQLVNFFFKKKSKPPKRSKFTKGSNNEESSKSVQESLIESKEVSEEEDLRIKRYFRDLYFYLLFLLILITIALTMMSTNMFYFSDVTAHIFMDTPNTPDKTNPSEITQTIGKTLREAKTIADFWAFAETTMIKLLYWKFYDSQVDPLEYSEEDNKKMFFENQILGVARIRQVRVTDDSCEIHPNMKRFFDKCYNFYWIFSEDTKPIKNGMEGSITSTAWIYTEAKKLNSSYYFGELSVYGGGGYYLDLGKTKEEARKMVEELKKNNWVSTATRAIFIDFNIYNANVNLFCLCKIVLEFPPVGGVISRAVFHPLKLIRYLNIIDFLILAGEFTLLLFVFYFTYVEIRFIMKQKTTFFFFFWNYVDVTILLLFYTCIALSIARYITVTRLVKSLSDRYHQYTEFTLVKDLQVSFNNVIAILVFLCWMKFFQYLNYNTVMVEFRAVISRSLKNIFGFFPIFITMFLAFTFLGYLLFGSQVKDYHTLWSSALALLQTFAGEFEYKQIQECNQLLGPLFYISYIFFIIFLALNVFIAIINDAYSSVKSKVFGDTPKTGEYLKRGFLNFIGFCCCGLDKKLGKKTTAKQKLVFENIRETLRRAGFSDTEIKIFFSKYDIDIRNVLSERTKKKIIEDLELKKADFTESSEQFQIKNLRRRIDDLNDKIEDIECSLLPVIDKVDILLRR